MCLSDVAKSSLSQMTLRWDYFLVLEVPVSTVKASQRARLAWWLENLDLSNRPVKRPDPSYPQAVIQGHCQGQEQVMRRTLASGSLFHK